MIGRRIPWARFSASLVTELPLPSSPPECLSCTGPVGSISEAKMKVQVLQHCTAQSGVAIEPGIYQCQIDWRPSDKGPAEPVCVLELLTFPYQANVTDLLKVGRVRWI